MTVANSLRDADLALLLNRQDLEYAIEQLRVKPERVHIVANGIPETFLNLPFESISEDAMIRIAQVGSYIPRKGIHYGVPALNAILTDYPRIEMSFLGTGCSQAQVHQDFDPLVCERVRVIPNYAHDSLPTLLKGHHIKLFPSLSEGFSLALTEAMACGLTPVATAIPGSTEIVVDGQNGILLPARDSSAIEQALRKLITDRLHLNQLCHNAYITAQSYSWKQIAQAQIALYKEALYKRETTNPSDQTSR